MEEATGSNSVQCGFESHLRYQVMPRKKRVLKEKVCEQCGAVYTPNATTQRFCGSRTQKIGCSWERRQYRDNHRWEDPNYREYFREYSKKWKREQREKNTDYAERQRKAKREKGKSPEGRAAANRWRRDNTEKVLRYNKRRELKKKGVEGTHTPREWKELKRYHNFTCVSCGISEKELKVLWAGTHFNKLTKDHVVPLSKGGTDFITNIQPMCISCNASKRDTLEGGADD